MLSSPSRHSCLSALFYAQHESAKNACRLFVSPATDHVLPLTRNTFLTYTPKISTYAIKCYNGTIKEGLQLMTLDTVSVPDNCVAVLPHYRLSPRLTYMWKLRIRVISGCIRSISFYHNPNEKFLMWSSTTTIFTRFPSLI